MCLVVRRPRSFDSVTLSSNFSSLTRPYFPCTRNMGWVLRGVLLRTNRCFPIFTFWFFFWICLLHDFETWNMSKSSSVQLYIWSEICCWSRYTVSWIFFLLYTTTQHGLLQASRHCHSFVMPRTWLDKLSFFIIEPIGLRELVKAFVSFEHFRPILVRSWKIVLWYKSFSLPFSKLSLLILEFWGEEVEVSIFVSILSRSRLSSFVGVQMVHRCNIRVWPPKHWENRAAWSWFFFIEAVVWLWLCVLALRKLCMKMDLGTVSYLK